MLSRIVPCGMGFQRNSSPFESRSHLGQFMINNPASPFVPSLTDTTDITVVRDSFHLTDSGSTEAHSLIVAHIGFAAPADGMDKKRPNAMWQGLYLGIVCFTGLDLNYLASVFDK